jgi:hypothetical protein
MQNQVSSTITIEFYKSIAEASMRNWIQRNENLDCYKSGFNSLSSLFINLLSIWPFIFILIAIGYLLENVLRQKKYKTMYSFFKKKL